MTGVQTCALPILAECSESAGSSFTPCFFAKGRTTGPPAIKVSLLARAMSLPASIAAMVGNNPADRKSVV